MIQIPWLVLERAEPSGETQASGHGGRAAEQAGRAAELGWRGSGPRHRLFRWQEMQRSKLLGPPGMEQSRQVK